MAITDRNRSYVLATSTNRPVRVVLNNMTPFSALAVSTDPTSVVNGNGSSEAYFVPFGRSVSLVIDKGEVLYGGGPGAGEGPALAVVVSVAYSDGLDSDHIEYVP